MAERKEKTNFILRWPDVQARIGLSRSHTHAMIAQGKFPAPVKLSLRASGWLESEINQWLADRVAASRPASGVEQ